MPLFIMVVLYFIGFIVISSTTLILLLIWALNSIKDDFPPASSEGELGEYN